MGCIGGGIEAPVPDAEKMQELITMAVKEIPKQIKKNDAQFPKDIKKAGSEPFTAPDTTIKLTSESTKEEIHKASIASAFGGKARDEVKDQVWGGLEEDLEGQLPEDAPGLVLFPTLLSVSL